MNIHFMKETCNETTYQFFYLIIIKIKREKHCFVSNIEMRISQTEQIDTIYALLPSKRP